jgi:hypothetical protein
MRKLKVRLTLPTPKFGVFFMLKTAEPKRKIGPKP